MGISLAAQAAESSAPRYATLVYDNDFFAGFDQHYTNGMQASFLLDRSLLPESVAGLPGVQERADRLFLFGIGQRIYTPTNSDLKEPEPRDRPYAGWLYALADVRLRQSDAVDHLFGSVGVVGPASLGQQVQHLSHVAFHAGQSQGWSSQLRNEPTVMVGYERAWPGIVATRPGGLRADLSPRVVGVAGNVFTYAAAGVIARVGYNLPDDVVANHVTLGPPRDGYRAAPAGFHGYLWTGADAYLVARNLFIDGNTFRDGPHVSRKPFVHDLQVGFVVGGPAAKFGFAVVRRSEEFREQPRADYYGSLTASFAY